MCNCDVLLFCVTAPACAEPVLTSATTGCTRAGLQELTNKYLDALKKGNPTLMPLAPQVKCIERRQKVPLGQGLWQKPFPIDFGRSIFEVDICESFTESIQANSDHPWVSRTRLKMSDGRISEIESLASDQRDRLFDSINYLKYLSAEKWDILPPGKRMDNLSLLISTSPGFPVEPPIRDKAVPFVPRVTNGMRGH